MDCSAGAALDGNAICIDGTESSVSYYAMNECVASANICSPGYGAQFLVNYTSQDDATRELVRSIVQQAITTEKQTLGDDQNVANANQDYANAVASGCQLGLTQLEQQRQAAIHAGIARAAQAGYFDTSPDTTSLTSAINRQYDQQELDLRQSCNPTAANMVSNDPKVQSDMMCLNNLTKLNYNLNNLEQGIQQQLEKAKQMQSMVDYCHRQGEIYATSSNQCTCPAGYHIYVVPGVNSSSCVSDTPITSSAPLPVVAPQNPVSIKTPIVSAPVKPRVKIVPTATSTQATTTPKDTIVATSTIVSSSTLIVQPATSTASRTVGYVISTPPSPKGGFWSKLFGAINPFNWFNRK
ncbi:MAG: hypothetical protein M1459_00420 [Patescibacteria group bacterium]|nr:hypothetical protein [Patescibacteria group bacterium]